MGKPIKNLVGGLGVGKVFELFNPPKPEIPAPPSAPPSRSDEEIQAEERDNRKRLAARQGRGSTILTGSAGATVGESNVGRKTLLGN